MKTSEPKAGKDYTGTFLYNESEDSLPVSQTSCKKIVELIEKGEECLFSLVEIVFVDEQQITAINQEHLERSYVTDIISFRYNEEAANQAVEGTLYGCAPRIRQQAKEYEQSPETEFCRIIIHGLLHLVGYEDQSDNDRKNMSAREDFYLEQL